MHRIASRTGRCSGILSMAKLATKSQMACTLRVTRQPTDPNECLAITGPSTCHTTTPHLTDSGDEQAGYG